MPFSESDRERYQRQLIIEGWDQKKLSMARVLIVGVGGLGGVSATYLAAAGVGQIMICDSDTVELSNLNRQILFTTADIGKQKATLAKRRLSELNPKINIEAVVERVTEKNISELISECDLIIDGLDNHSSRLTLNQASSDFGIPYIYGAINEWMGQLAFINPPKTACLACIFQHEMKVSETSPVFGALPGVIGSMQATVAIRYLMTGAAPFSNLMLIFHADTMGIETVLFDKDPSCPVCGK
jgi:molybdopterin-synthase adenylyltransferase